MGIQPVQDVDLIRHAYVIPGSQRLGVGGALIDHLMRSATRRVLVGTWAAAEWAIAFYRRHGFVQVSPEDEDPAAADATGTSPTARSRPRWCSPTRRSTRWTRASRPAHRGGEGPPLVLLHGFTGSWRIWELVLPALERGTTCSRRRCRATRAARRSTAS